VGRTGLLEQTDKQAELLGAEVPKLPQVAFLDRLIELAQQREALVGDADPHLSAVLGGPDALGQSLPFQLID
jgi:hypothetical protein